MPGLERLWLTDSLIIPKVLRITIGSASAESFSSDENFIVSFNDERGYFREKTFLKIVKKKNFMNVFFKKCIFLLLKVRLTYTR